MSAIDSLVPMHLTATSFILPHQNLAKSHHFLVVQKAHNHLKNINKNIIHLALDNDFYFGVKMHMFY